MSTSNKQKRLDKIELQLSPRECAIMLVDEVRRYPSAEYFLKALAKRAYREWPTVAPFLALMEQAGQRYPGNNPKKIQARKELGRKLRTEFSFYRGLFVGVNEAVAEKTTALGSRAALILSRFQMLVWQDAFGRTSRRAASWIGRYKTTGAEEEENRQSMLNELASYPSVSFGDEPVDTVLVVAPPRVRFRSLIDGLADELTMLVLDVFMHRASVRAIEETHFDDHGILWRDVKSKLGETMKAAESAVVSFNEYVKARSQLDQENGNQEEQESESTSAKPNEPEGQLSIDIDAIQKHAAELAGSLAAEWAKEAKEKAIVDSLEETGEHGDYVVQTLRRQLGVKP